jgi:hypothetical protein
MDWEVKQRLNHVRTLNFYSYLQNWKWSTIWVPYRHVHNKMISLMNEQSRYIRTITLQITLEDCPKLFSTN